MFGYVAVNKAELKFREFEVYQSYYCGLCKTLKESGGNISRLALSYDMTFVYMLLSGLYEPETVHGPCKCMLHPFEKRAMRRNVCAEYTADMSVLLTCYKCKDDWLDDRKFSRRLMLSALAKKNNAIVRRYKDKTMKIAEIMEQLAAGERRKSTDIDEMAGLFGKIMAEILVYQEDEWEPALSKMGFYLGKFIYLIDAYEDIEEDIAKNRYNPLVKIYQNPDFEGVCQQILMMMIAECSREFEKLPILENADILRNILYSGVWVKYEAIRAKREEQVNGHE